MSAYRGQCISSPELEKDFETQCEQERDLYILGATANQTFLARAFFEDPSILRYFELVYSSPQIRIYKVL